MDTRVGPGDCDFGLAAAADAALIDGHPSHAPHNQVKLRRSGRRGPDRWTQAHAILKGLARRAAAADAALIDGHL